MATVKCATAGLQKVAMPAALRQRELAALGERVYRSLRGAQNPLSKLYWHLLPGDINTNRLETLIGGYARNFRKTPQNLRPSFRSNFQDDLQDAYRQIGEMAEPRMQFFNRTLPMTGGLTAGGLAGFGAGSLQGRFAEQDRTQEVLHTAPLIDRLRYLFAPSRPPMARRPAPTPAPTETIDDNLPYE